MKRDWWAAPSYCQRGKVSKHKHTKVSEGRTSFIYWHLRQNVHYHPVTLIFQIPIFFSSILLAKWACYNLELTTALLFPKLPVLSTLWDECPYVPIGYSRLFASVCFHPFQANFQALHSSYQIHQSRCKFLIHISPSWNILLSSIQRLPTLHSAVQAQFCPKASYPQNTLFSKFLKNLLTLYLIWHDAILNSLM